MRKRQRAKLRTRAQITAAEAGRRAWKGTTRAQRSAVMRARVHARWYFPCGQKRNGAHFDSQCSTPECPGRQEAP